MVRLFPFEREILREEKALAQQLYRSREEALRGAGRLGALGDDPNATVYQEEFLVETTRLSVEQYDRLIDNAQIVDVNTEEPVDFVREGAYVVLRCFDPKEEDESRRETVEKYVVAHIGRSDLRLLNMEAGLGKLLIENKAGLDDMVTLPSGVTYKVLELSWGVPVIELERPLTKEYRDLHSSLENALRNREGVGGVRDEIEEKIAQAKAQRQELVQDYFEKAKVLILIMEGLPNPLEYVTASPRGRVEIRESTPSQLIHYHRTVDSLSTYIQDLNNLLKHD